MADEKNTNSLSSDSESVTKSNFVSWWVQHLHDPENSKFLDAYRKKGNGKIHPSRFLPHAQFHSPTPLRSAARIPTPTSTIIEAAICFEDNSHGSDADDEDDTNCNDFERNRPRRKLVKRKRLLMEPDSSSDEEESPQYHVSCNKWGESPSKGFAFADHHGEPTIFFDAPSETNNWSDYERYCERLINAAPPSDEELPQNHVNYEKWVYRAPSEEVEFADHRGEPVPFLDALLEPYNCYNCEGYCDCLIDAAPLQEEGQESVNDAAVLDFNLSQELTLECIIWHSYCIIP